MKFLTWQNPEQLFVAQELINKVKSKCCGIKVIEFKANAESGCHKTISKRYDKAIEQLQTTINIFNQHYSVQNTDVTTLRNVEAYICFRQGYPKFTSMQMNYKAKFTQQNHGIPLSFATTKIF